MLFLFVRTNIFSTTKIFVDPIFVNLKFCGHLHLEWDQEKSSSGKKFELPKKSNFFPLELFPQIFFWFIWKQRCNGRPLILKLVPNDEE